MRILFITHLFYPRIGGIEVNSEVLANGFSDSGHDVRLLTWAEDASGKAFRYPVIRKPTVAQLIREHRWADVVFENNPCLRLAWPAFFLNKSSVVAVRTWINRNDGRLGWQDRLKIWWLGRAKSVIAVSKVIRDACWPKAVVIGNPYRSEMFRRLPGRVPSKDFVFLGRLVSDKGADVAIRSLHGLMQTDISEASKESLALTIIGDGPEIGSLKQLAADLGIGAKVNFMGEITGDDLVSILNDHKYLLVTSLWREPFGNVALEGMACGCVPFVSSGGGLSDAVGDAGVVFERGDPDSLVAEILKVLRSSSLEKDLRIRAANHLQQHLPDVVCRRYLDEITGVKK